jgi:hypothetical protein
MQTLNGPGSSSSLFPQELCKAFACAALIEDSRRDTEGPRKLVQIWNELEEYFYKHVKFR